MEKTIGVKPFGLILGSRSASAMLLVAGLVFCLGSTFGITKALCVTEGCKIYQNYSILGLSFHVWGAAAFGTALVLLVRRSAYYRWFIYFCLWAEITLLAYQIIYLPCSECLLVGLLWGLLAFIEIRKQLSLMVWSGLFLAALVLMAKELIVPWPVYGNMEAPVKIFFSPTCEACRDEIGKLLASGRISWDQVALCPVALNDTDCERVYSMKCVFDRTLNLDQAFQVCWSGDAQISLNWQEWLRFKYFLIKNRLYLARLGTEKIPVVISGSVALDEPSGDCNLLDGCQEEENQEETHYVS